MSEQLVSRPGKSPPACRPDTTAELSTLCSADSDVRCRAESPQSHETEIQVLCDVRDNSIWSRSEETSKKELIRKKN
jgi:hypothetical protein